MRKLEPGKLLSSYYSNRLTDILRPSFELTAYIAIVWQS